MFLNVYNLLLLDHIIPGTIVALVLAWIIASWSTRQSALREAVAHADSLQLVGGDRENFLDWRRGELLDSAQEKVGPMTGVYFTLLMLLFLATGIFSCSGPKERKGPSVPPEKPNQQAPVQDARRGFTPHT